MKLSVKNIGKIDFAEIEISGITVIGGLNNTGKSTISKSLFAIFNSLHGLSKQVRKARIESIARVFRESSNFVEEFVRQDLQISYFELASLVVDLTNEEDIENIMVKASISKEFSEEVVPRVIASNAISLKQIAEEIVQKVFRDEFNNRIQNIYSKEKVSKVTLDIKGKKFDIEIGGFNKDIEFDEFKELDYEVVYIDDPFIVNSHNLIRSGRLSPLFRLNRYELKDHRNLLIDQLKRDDELDYVEKATIKARTQDVYAKINKILGDTDKMVFSNRDYQQDEIPSDQLPVDSLSAGMKTFYLIKSLLDNGTIVEKGTLILDEPEIHLHPSWQLNMAEIIVLLQRELKLHILINTNSPYFLRAIDVYSRKYDISQNTNYYLSFNSGDYAILNKVEDLSEIYKILAEPLQRIENEGI